jgi:hypothetical protein
MSNGAAQREAAIPPGEGPGLGLLGDTLQRLQVAALMTLIGSAWRP